MADQQPRAAAAQAALTAIQREEVIGRILSQLQCNLSAKCREDLVYTATGNTWDELYDEIKEILEDWRSMAFNDTESSADVVKRAVIHIRKERERVESLESNLKTALNRQNTADTEIEETENNTHINRLKRKIELKKESIESNVLLIKRAAEMIAESACLL